MLSSHRLPVTDLDEVATGRLSAAAAARMAAAERSRRLLMFRAVAAAEADGGADPESPLPPVTEAFDVLARAERFAPEPVAVLMAHPPVGVWAVRMLRRLGGTGLAQDPPPWHELGYAHALAGAAAVRGGMPVTLRLPAVSGTVVLPTVGRAEFPGVPAGCRTAELDVVDGGTATLSLGGRRLRLTDGGRRAAPSEAVWRPAAYPLTGYADAHRGILLDDADPYRDFRTPGAAGTPLSGPERERWDTLLGAAAGILRDRHPRPARTVSLVLNTLVPLPGMPRFRTTSASYTEAVGSALISLPHDGADLAAALVHEARHSLLNGLQHQVSLVEPADPEGDGALFYAPWRMDPRPLWGLLHGAYAFAGVAGFWRTERTAADGRTGDLAHFEYAVLRGALSDVLATLSARDGLTEWGRRFVRLLREQTASWADDQVPDAPLAHARAELADLRATWRLRNLRPESSACHRLARQWTNGASAPETASVPAHPRAQPLFGWPETRGELRRALLAPPPAGDPPSYERAPGLLTADRLLVAGDHQEARRHYVKILDETADHPAAWTGLGLALDAAGRTEEARVLLTRPEVARALTASITALGAPAPDAVDLCRWLAREPGLTRPDGRG